MRIAWISADHGIPIYGNKGAAIHARELSTAMSVAGHEVRIFACRLGGDVPAGFDVPAHEISLGNDQSSLLKAMKADSAISDQMLKEIRSMLYNVTLTHELEPTLDEWRPDAIYERYSLMSTAGIDLAQRLGVPHILEVNAPLAAEAEMYRGLGFSHTVHETERRILQSADYVLAVSAELRDWLIKAGVSRERIAVTPNRVNIQRFVNVVGSPEGRPTVGFVGTLKAWHGTATLVRAVGEIARQCGNDAAPALVIVGDGPQRAALEALAREEGIEEMVRFTGTVAHGDIPAYMGAFDIAVAPYNPLPHFYFSPLKIFEYMAAGRAIVAADIGQIPQIIDHGRTGLLVQPGDEAALASSIMALVDDPGQREMLGENARRDAALHHSWARNVEVVTNLIAKAPAHVGDKH